MIELFRTTAPTTPARPANRVLVIGDSHSLFWTGVNDLNAKESILEKLSVNRIGPVTALSLPSPKGEVHKILDNLIGAAPGEFGLIITCFGEVDIRAHVITLALLRNCPLDEIVREIATCYLRFVDAVTAKYKIPVVIWGPPPSRPFEGLAYNRAVPVVGSPTERNYATHILTELLDQECAGRQNVGFCTLFRQLVGPDYRTRPDALFDNCHLSNIHFGSAIKAITPVLEKLGLKHLEESFKFRFDIQPRSKVINLSGACRWQVDPKADNKDTLQVDMFSGYHLHHIAVPRHGEVSKGVFLNEVLVGDPDRLETVYPGPSAQMEDLDSHTDEIRLQVRKPHRFMKLRFSGPVDLATRLKIGIFATAYTETLR